MGNDQWWFESLKMYTETFEVCAVLFETVDQHGSIAYRKRQKWCMCCHLEDGSTWLPTVCSSCLDWSQQIPRELMFEWCAWGLKKACIHRPSPDWCTRLMALVTPAFTGQICWSFALIRGIGFLFLACHCGLLCQIHHLQLWIAWLDAGGPNI